MNILFGYYDCHEIVANEIVAYDYAGNENPVIKIVKALPGDSFSLKESDELPGDSFSLKESDENFGWNLFVNDEIAANSILGKVEW